ncbi:MAG: tripartite tricarboxylate transporter substrate binding protein [Burkholderiales bacterium]|nr:tripartite tricarboxylate transporter substrate binding protein [Burkholderiales bacterium]
MRFRKQSTIVAGLSMLALGAVGPAGAQAYPKGAVNLITGGAAGGPLDIVARRVVAQPLQEAWGQPVVVLNQVGVGGMIASNTVARSAPDGRNLLLETTAFVINPTLHAATIPFDTLRDFAFVTQLVSLHVALVTNAAAPYSTVGELIAYAKARPGKLTYASPIIGSASHLAGEMFNIEAGVDIMHVPYKGSPAATLDLVAGRVDTMFNALSASKPLVDQGKLKILALAAGTRTADIKDYPLIADRLPGFDVTSFLGLMARGGTPRPVIDKIQRDLVQAMNKPDIRALLDKMGMTVVGSTPDAFDAYARVEVAKWGKVIKASNIKPN